MSLNTLSPFIPQSDLILPSGYDDSMSYYEVLEKIVVFLNDTISQTNVNTDNIEYFKKFVQDKLEGYSDEIIEQVIEIIKKGNIFTAGSINPSVFGAEFLQTIRKVISEQLSQMTKGIFFTLESGFLVINIPEAWKELKFSTDEEGRLVLSID